MLAMSQKQVVMPLLRAEPAGRIRSMREFFAIARAIEMDAAARYTETARRLREENATELADLFAQLAETERGHVREIDQWAEHRGEQPAADLPWSIPDTFDAPPEEVARTRLMTPYRALASAVRHEQRSFTFWSYVAAHAEVREVQDAAERMALAELGHIALLRSERRKAFHAERRKAGRGDTRLTPGTLASAERKLAELIESNPASAGDPTSAAVLAASARDAAVALEALEAAARYPRFSAPHLPAGSEADIAARAEYLAEAYLRLADMSRDGHVLAVAQELARSAIHRLGALKKGEQTRRTR